MNKYLKKLLCIMLSIATIISVSTTGIYANDSLSRSSKGEYLIINSKSNKLGYFKDGKLVKQFPVATGKPSTPTPTGKFKIVNKIKNRPYYSGGIPGGSPNNPLGDRWIGLQVGATYGTTYAVHGNNNESSIGKHISGGCIRMHNKDVRWLYDQIGVGGYAIIDYSDRSFIQIAAKYGVVLEDSDSISQNVKNVQEAYKSFTNYKNKINLTNTNSMITSSLDATNILASKVSYMQAYNKLSTTEKNRADIQKIHGEFNKIVSIVEFAEASLRFYENITANAEYIKLDIDWIGRLNTHNSDELGTRGKALNEYNEAVLYGENKDNSKRMQYLDRVYTDSVLYLLTCEYVNNKEVVLAKETVNRIEDSNLKSIANAYINELSDIVGHWAEQDIAQAMKEGWVDNTNKFRPSDSITRAEFIKIVNRAFGFTEKAEISFGDVSFGQWYYDEVCIAVKAGYIDGDDLNNFNPNHNITRQEVAKIITKITNSVDENIDKVLSYKDANQVSDWALPYVEGAIERGYMGNGGTEFRPKDSITRAESVVTLRRTK